MKVCLGGTFNIIHKGHELLFDKAFSDDNHVFIGLTSDELVRGKKGVMVRDYNTRKRGLASYLEGKGWKGRFIITKLVDRLGPAVSGDYDAIVVSEETRKGAGAINRARRKNSLKPLRIMTVKMALAENGDVISSTRIKKGEMDSEGKMQRRVVVCVGSENQVKVKAVEHVFLGLFPGVSVKGKRVKVNVPAQPKENEVIKGAIQRARKAFEMGCDFSVGIEAGLIWNEVTKRHFDVQFCAVCDRAGRLTMGHGGGFYYPEVIMKHIAQGMTVGESMEKEFGMKNIGRKKGAIGFLSRDAMDRSALTEQAVIMAMIPRIRRELYE